MAEESARRTRKRWRSGDQIDDLSASHRPGGAGTAGDALLRLQRTAGNAAVAGMLTREPDRAPPGVVQRVLSDVLREHIQAYIEERLAAQAIPESERATLGQQILNAVNSRSEIDSPEKAEKEANRIITLQVERRRKSAEEKAPTTEKKTSTIGPTKSTIGPTREPRRFSEKPSHPYGEPKRVSEDLQSVALDRARALRDRIADQLADDYRGTEYGPPAAVVGAINIKTGRYVVGESGTAPGVCAEDDAVDRLGCAPHLVLFTSAVRPRNGDDVPVCRKCQGNYGREQFEDGTNFA